MAELQAAQEALLDPRHQLRSAVVLQIGQLNELMAVLRTFQELMARAGEEWGGWINQSQGLFEAGQRSLEELRQAKREQEELLTSLRQGWIQARDADTLRIEVGLRNLAGASQELKGATEAVCGTGKGFQAQVQTALENLEGRLELCLQRFQRALRPLGWIGASLGMLAALDILVRVLK